jgi:uncharacterized protein (TIGR00369 family)
MQRQSKSEPLKRDEINARLRRMPLGHSFGFRVARVYKDGLTMEYRVKDEHRNVLGTLHGGVMATLVDTATGVAIIAHYGGKRPTTTVELKVNYLKPVSDGIVRARARFVKLGKTLAVCACDVADSHGHPVAVGLVTYMMLDVPSAG